jgi:hypothetical protein
VFLQERAGAKNSLDDELTAAERQEIVDAAAAALLADRRLLRDELLAAGKVEAAWLCWMPFSAEPWLEDKKRGFSIAGAVRDAFDRLADAGARLTFARVRKYVLADADGRTINPGWLRCFYEQERKKRQRDRDWRRLLASLPTMKAKKFAALSKRVDRILVGGADGSEREFYKWAVALQPHIGAEQDRRAAMAERTRPRMGRRRTTTVDEDLLLAEIATHRQVGTRGGRGRGRVSLSTAPEVPQTLGLFDQPPATSAPRPGTYESLMAHLRRNQEAAIRYDSQK